MRAGLLAVSVAGAAALVTAPATGSFAADDDGGSIAATPRSAPAGTDVDLRVTGCDGTTGTARSTAFASDARLAPSADEPTLFAEARVTSSTAPGAYPVTVTCDGVEGKVTGTLHVVEADTPATPSPTALVHAGGGGTAPQQQALAVQGNPAAAPSEGPGTRHALIGLGLAAVAAVAVAVRSVRRRRAPGSPTRH